MLSESATILMQNIALNTNSGATSVQTKRQAIALHEWIILTSVSYLILTIVF